MAVDPRSLWQRSWWPHGRPQATDQSRTAVGSDADSLGPMLIVASSILLMRLLQNHLNYAAQRYLDAEVQRDLDA